MTATRITDAGVAKLVAVPNIEVLNLEGTLVTDDCVQYLKKLRSLRTLILEDTHVSKAARDSLRACFPAIEIQ